MRLHPQLIWLAVAITTLLPFCLLHNVHAGETELSPKYFVKWEYNRSTDEVLFDVVVETTGWVGLGFSSNGAMTQADIVIGGLRDGELYFNDYHGPENGNSAPIPDTTNDYELLSAVENGTHTRISFKRKRDTCDPQDMEFTEAGLRMIWAFGSTDIIAYHSSERGSKSVYILDPEMPAFDLTEFNEFKIVSNTTLQPVQTTYWCTIHRLPELSGPHHMIAYQPLFLSPNAGKYSHHMSIFKCLGPDEMYEDYVGHEGVECSSGSPGGFGRYCDILEYSWALGGELTVNPDGIGFPFRSGQYYKLQVHLNNPNLNEGELVQTGFSIYYTNEIRPITGSLIMISAPANYGLMVPPNQAEFTATAHCMSECLSRELIPVEGVKVYNVFLHAHTSARKMRIRHYRNGSELPWIINDENYDFRYQTNRRLPEEVLILPGDQITAECIYDTNWKNGKSVIGGQSADDEMCMVLLAYYPEIPELVGCQDEPDVQRMLNFLGIQAVDPSNGSSDPEVTAPEQLRGKLFSQVVEEFDWTAERREQYQLLHKFGNHSTSCLPRNVRVLGTYPSGDIYEPPPKQCQEVTTTTTVATTPTTTTPTPPSPTFDCTNKPDGFYSSPYACERYFGCLGGETFEFECPPSFHFNPDQQVCDLPEVVNCDLDCWGKEDGFYPHWLYCPFYLRCLNGSSQVLECPSPLLFDRVELKCNFPHLVNCTSSL